MLLPSSRSLQPFFRTAFVLLLLLVAPVLAHAQAPAFDLVVPIGPGPNAVTHTAAIAVDAAGNSYVTGEFGGTATFGTTTLVSSNTDIYVAKLDPTGRVVWAAQAGGQYIEFSTAIALDASGNVYITGDFLSPTILFGSHSLTNSVNGLDLATREAYVAKLSPTGQWLWATKAGGAGPDTGRDIAVDASGNAYIVGQYASTARFGTTTLPKPVLASNSFHSDVFVAKIDPQGAWQWARNSGSGGGYIGSSIALDAAGNVYLAGSAVGSTQPAPGPFSLNTPGLFVAKLTGQGSLLWATPGAGSVGYGSFGNNMYAGTVQIAVDRQGNAYTSGGFVGALTLGTQTLTATSTDVFVAKLSAAGTYRWAVQAGSNGRDFCNSVAVDAGGNCFVTGSFETTARFGAFSLTSTTDHDAFTGMLTPSGTWRWVTPVAGSRTDNGLCVAVGPGGTTYMGVEAFQYPVKFGDGTGAGINGVYYGRPGFVARLAAFPSLELTGDSVVCNGGQVRLTATTTGAISGYRWSTGATTASITVSQAGTYSVTATFSNGYSLTEQYRVRSLAPVVQLTGGTAPLCPGSATTLLATAPGAWALRWSTGATTAAITVTEPGTYTVTAEYSTACAATAQVVVVSNAVSIRGRLQLCPGQSTTLTAAGTGAAVTSYRWSTGETAATLRVTQAGRYSVTATFADGCVAQAAHTVGPPTAKVASVSGDTLLCPGTSLHLTALNPDASSYQWNTGATTPDITLSKPGRYSVLLTYPGGCTSRDSLDVEAAPPAPVFTLGPDTTLCLEKTLVLRAPAVSGPGVSWRWSDGSAGPTLRVEQPGRYSLQITTPCDSRTVSRHVAYESCFLAPNIITPNDDNRNDTFVINEPSRGPWRLEIYSRWGQRVYETSRYRNDWGRTAAPGTYYYLLRPAGNGAATKGWLEVVR